MISLSIYSDELVPSEVTALLGIEPSHAHAAGDRHFGKDGREYARRHTGMWRLKASQDPGEFEFRVMQLLQRLPYPSAAWDIILNQHTVKLVIGLFMNKGNEELDLSPSLLQAVGERGIAISLEIYAP
jgi:hypothetical protein